MGIRANIVAALAKRETAYGTDAAPTAAADGVLLHDFDLTPLDQEYVDRTLVRHFFGAPEQIPTRSFARAQFMVELAGFGAAGPATPTAGLSALLRANGLSQTIAASVDVQYAPISGSFDSATIWTYIDGLAHKITGARGTWGFDMTVNEIPYLTFDMVGRYVAVADLPMISPTLTAYQTPKVVNSANTTGFQLHSMTTALLRSMSFRANNEIALRNLVGSSDEILIVNRAPEANFDIEQTLVATKDWFAAIKAGTIGNLAITHGPATNQVVFTSSRLQLIEPDYDIVDNILHLTTGGRFVPSAAGNDDYLLTIK